MEKNRIKYQEAVYNLGDEPEENELDELDKLVKFIDDAMSYIPDDLRNADDCSPMKDFLDNMKLKSPDVDKD